MWCWSFGANNGAASLKMGKEVRRKDLIESSDSNTIDAHTVALRADVECMISLENLEGDAGIEKPLSECQARNSGATDDYR